MQFNSCTFVLFFAAVLLLHNLPLPWRVRKFNLLIASYLFYAAWNPPFVVLLWISTLVDWFVAARMARTRWRGGRTLLLLVSLGVNLGLLGFFKYGTFALENFQALLGLFGVQYAPPKLDLVLPVGISFYTFQTLSYTLDVYRQKARPWSSFLDYAMYVTFFPQLVAGPIVRAVDFLPQCPEPRRANATALGWGLSLLVLGLFEKIVVADGLLAPVSEAVYDTKAAPDCWSAWIGTLAFAGQIFCDFAGYSTCAIGAAVCLGFHLPRNFRFPYAAIGFSDFWRRWHISLSTWLRDYLYISLGGNRKGKIRTYVNLMLTMLIGGLWHGASWMFVIWGGLHGLYLMAERMLSARFKGAAWAGHPATRTALGAATFALVCFAWVFFRARTLNGALQITRALGGMSAAGAKRLVESEGAYLALATMVLMLAVQVSARNSTLEEVAGRTPAWLRVTLIALMVVSITTMPGEDRAFIYFQF